MKKPKFVEAVIEKITHKEKNESRIFEQSLSKLNPDFTVRITGNKIVIKDGVTYLKVLPKDGGEIVLEKSGDKLTIAIEKIVKDE